MGKYKPHGLVADLWPNVRLMQLSGHFLFEYHDNNSAINVLARKIYSWVHLVSFHIGFCSKKEKRKKVLVKNKRNFFFSIGININKLFGHNCKSCYGIR